VIRRGGCVNIMSYLKTLDGEEYRLKGMAPIECFRCGICCQHYRLSKAADRLSKVVRHSVGDS
jgi:hypothetical protein